MGEEGEEAFPVQIKRSFEGWKQGHERLPEAGDGPVLISDQIATASEEEPQFGDLFLAGLKLAEVLPHPGLVGDDTGIPGVGLGLAAVGVTGPVYGESGDVEDPLVSLPQQRQQKRRRASGLIYRPEDLFREAESLVYEFGELGLVVFYLPGEQLCPRGVEHVRPVRLFSRIYADPGSVHDHLRPSLTGLLPSEHPADGSLRSDFSPISISGRGLQREPRGDSSRAIERQAFSSHPRPPWASSRIRTWTTRIKVGRLSRRSRASCRRQGPELTRPWWRR